MKALLITLLLLFCHGGIAHAQVFKCVKGNGSISYSDTPCEIEPGKSIKTKPLNASAKHTENHALQEKFSVNSIAALAHKSVDAYFYPIVFSIYLLMSVICYFAYRKDKKSAQARQWRTPESTLHLYEFLGGWPGGFIAQRTLRHKNRKVSYQAGFWFIVTLHIAGWVDYLVLNKLLLSRIIDFVSSSI